MQRSASGDIGNTPAQLGSDQARSCHAALLRRMILQFDFFCLAVETFG